jgi:hypothetical protein
MSSLLVFNLSSCGPDCGHVAVGFCERVSPSGNTATLYVKRGPVRGHVGLYVNTWACMLTRGPVHGNTWACPWTRGLVCYYVGLSVDTCGPVRGHLGLYVTTWACPWTDVGLYVTTWACPWTRGPVCYHVDLSAAI